MGFQSKQIGKASLLFSKKFISKLLFAKKGETLRLKVLSRVILRSLL